MSGQMAWASAVDAALEASVVGSFSRTGYEVRSRLEHWTALPSQRGRVAVVTGASSGIGAAAAVSLARLGASVWLLGRDPCRTEDVARRARCAAHKGGATEARIEPVVLDLLDVAAVERFSERLRARHLEVHALVHAAGALFPRYHAAPDGTELTLATAVLAPYRLTWLLAGPLRRGSGGTIVMVSSGGMYTERFDIDRLELTPDGYRGTRAYARAKRAQVVLSHLWAHRWGADGVASYAMHPGWVDTPGLAQGLPSFTKLGPLLRSAEQGADTAVWLAAGCARAANGPAEGFFHDRRPRSEHRLVGTRNRRDAAVDEADLWAWCAARTGLSGIPPE